MPWTGQDRDGEGRRDRAKQRQMERDGGTGRWGKEEGGGKEGWNLFEFDFVFIKEREAVGGGRYDPLKRYTLELSCVFFQCED